MRRIEVLLFFFSLSFAEVEPFKYDKTKQIEFLQQRSKEMICWNATTVLSRKVMSHGKQISINDFFEVSSANLLRKWPIKKDTVDDLTNIMITILSCEFNDFSFYIVEYVKYHFESCKYLKEDSVKYTQNRTDENFKKYLECINIIFKRLQLVPSYISQMIFTLIDFSRYRINSEYNKQDALKTLLSWFLGLQNIVVDLGNLSEKEIENNIEILMVIIFQMKNAFSEYDIRYCRPQSDHNDFIYSLAPLVHETIWSEINNKLSYHFYTKKSREDDGPVKYWYILESFKNTSVLNDGIKYTQLLGTIKMKLSIKINWNNEDLSPEEIYNRYIKNCTNIRTILKYEQSMLGLMTGLVYGKALGELEPVLNGEFREEMASLFTNKSDIIDKVVSNAESSTLPLMFVNNMKIFIHELATVAQYLRSPETFALAKKHFHSTILAAKNRIPSVTGWLDPQATKCYFENHELKLIGTNESQSAVTCDLQRFLEYFVSVHINNTYLLRTVIDVLIDSSHIIMAGMFDYAFDHNKTVFTVWENKNETFCASAVKAACAANTVYQDVNNITTNYPADEKSDIDKLVLPNSEFMNILKKFNNDILDLKTCVVNLLLTAYEDEQFFDADYRLRKILLTFFYNEENVTLFNNISQLMLLDDESLLKLTSFIYILEYQIKLYIQLMCAKYPSPISHDLPGEVTSFLTRNNRDLKNYIRKTYKTLINGTTETTSPNFKPLTAQPETDTDDNIVLCFNAVKNFNEFISKNSEVFYGSKIKFYWKQNEWSIESIQNEFSVNTFNLQDVIEYQLLTINWVVGSVLLLFINILDGLIDYKLNREIISTCCFETQLKYFLPLLDNIFVYNRTILIFKWFNDVILYENEHDYLAKFKRIIVEELKYFGIVLTSMPMDLLVNDIFTNVRNVCKNVTVLEDSHFSNLLKLVGVKQVLT